MIDAAVAHAVSRADAAIAAEPIDHLPADEALARLIRSTWRRIGDFGGLLTAIARHLRPDHFHHRHLEAALGRIDTLIARGQDEGVFRTDLPRAWLVTTFHTLLHAAVHEVEAGHLDPKVPYAESVGAIRDLLDAGKIRMAGISNASVAQIQQAQEILGGRLASVQNQFSPAFRSSEPELELCARLDVAFLPWSPLGGISRAGELGSTPPSCA